MPGPPVRGARVHRPAAGLCEVLQFIAPPQACERCSSSSPLATSYCTSDGAAPAGPPSSSFARSYASDFSPASAEGRRGGATGAPSPPTTHGVHLAPSRLRAPTGAATCSSPAHGACALRHRDRMAPVVVAANSRGGYSRLPTEQRVTTSSCSARAQRSRESPTRCRMVAVVPMRTCWSRPAATVATPMAPMDGSNGTETSDCVDVPPVRLCDRGERQP